MIIFPELPNVTCRAEIEPWIAQTWTPDRLQDFASTVDLRLTTESIFSGASWAPLGNRISILDLQQIRHEMVDCIDAIEPLIPSEQLSSMNRSTDCDRAIALVIWKYLSSLGEGMASSSDSWRWFAVRIIPDLIIRRWVKDGGRVSVDRFLNTTKVRCWPQHLWWYAWICCNDEGVVNDELLHFMKSADARSSMLERTGGGYSRAILQAIMKQIIRVKASGESQQSTEFLLRGMMVRLSWLSGARNIDALDEKGRQELSCELCSWAEEHYTGKR